MHVMMLLFWHHHDDHDDTQAATLPVAYLAALHHRKHAATVGVV
jgi:hypothetical protein